MTDPARLTGGHGNSVPVCDDEAARLQSRQQNQSIEGRPLTRSHGNSVLFLETHKNSVLVQSHRNSVRTDRFRVDEHYPREVIRLAGRGCEGEVPPRRAAGTGG